MADNWEHGLFINKKLKSSFLDMLNASAAWEDWVKN
jgi:hypothetical protein